MGLSKTDHVKPLRESKNSLGGFLIYLRINQHGHGIHVIDLEKNNAAVYYHRSLIYKQIGKADESASDLKKAAQLGDVRAQKAIKK